MCNAATSLGVIDDTPASQETNLCGPSTVGEGESKNSSDDLLRRQGIEEPTEETSNQDNFVFTGPITFDSEFPEVNLLSTSSDEVDEKQDKDNVPSTSSSYPGRNPSVIKCLQENLETAKTLAQQKPYKLSKRTCKKCRRHFFKKSTFDAHLRGHCNPKKHYKCHQCNKVFSYINKLLRHQRVHTGEKSFKCYQCDFASAWQHCLDGHLETHTNNLTSLVGKYFQETSATTKTVPPENPQTSNKKYKSKRSVCKRCGKYFVKEETFLAHVQSKCHPKPFKCDNCDERFPSMSSLSKHQRLHTGEKLFKCNQCGYASAWQYCLDGHLETHTKK